jgi:hypothetical protein
MHGVHHYTIYLMGNASSALTSLANLESDMILFPGPNKILSLLCRIMKTNRRHHNVRCLFSSRPLSFSMLDHWVLRTYGLVINQPKFVDALSGSNPHGHSLGHKRRDVLGDLRWPVVHEELAVTWKHVSLGGAHHHSCLDRLLNSFLLRQNMIPMIDCSNDLFLRFIATQKVKGCREALLDIP